MKPGGCPATPRAKWPGVDLQHGKQLRHRLHPLRDPADRTRRPDRQEYRSAFDGGQQPGVLGALTDPFTRGDYHGGSDTAASVG